MPVLVSTAIVSSTKSRPVDEISNETMCILAKETTVPKPVCTYIIVVVFIIMEPSILVFISVSC